MRNICFVNNYKSYSWVPWKRKIQFSNNIYINFSNNKFKFCKSYISIHIDRYNGRRILNCLMAHPDFDKMLDKHLPANTLRSMRDIVDNLQKKVSYVTKVKKKICLQKYGQK